MSRLLQAVLVVFAAASIAFLLLHAAPGDPYVRFGDTPGASADATARRRARFGADQPLAVQYVRYMQQAARGDFGVTVNTRQEVSALIAQHLPPTLLLMSLALLSSIVAGVFIGAWQGANAGSRGDRALSAATLATYSIPEFWLAMVLLLVFAHKLGMPTGNTTSVGYDYMAPGEQLWDRLKHLALPWLTLTLVATAVFARFQRAAMRETWQEPFVRTARAKGLPERVVRRHALRASLLPVVTIAGVLFPALVGGAVFVETVFSWPGMGALVYQSIMGHEYWTVCGSVIVISAVTAIGTLLADLMRLVVDPRLRQT